MPISFDDIELAFLFVSSDSKNMNNAFLCRETGEIFHTSEMGDSDEFGELPEDIGDPEKYISVPHKNDLELGKTLVLEFTSEYLLEELDTGYMPSFAERAHMHGTRTFCMKRASLTNGTTLKMNTSKRL